MTHHPDDRIISLFFLVGMVAVFLSAPVLAQSQEKGDGSLRIEYQYIRTGDFSDANFDFDYWTTDSHIALLSGDYALSDR